MRIAIYIFIPNRDIFSYLPAAVILDDAVGENREGLLSSVDFLLIELDTLLDCCGVRT